MTLSWPCGNAMDSRCNAGMAWSALGPDDGVAVQQADIWSNATALLSGSPVEAVPGGIGGAYGATEVFQDQP